MRMMRSLPHVRFLPALWTDPLVATIGAVLPQFEHGSNSGRSGRERQVVLQRTMFSAGASPTGEWCAVEVGAIGRYARTISSSG